MNGFSIGYTRFYDLFYKEKDYEEECRFLADIFSHYSVKDILDIACGTGGHLLCLDAMGYNVHGMDASPAMIEMAKKKLFCPLDVKRMENFLIDKKFDAVIAMFNSVGYSDDLFQVFVDVKKHLKDDGLFVFDFWNKMAVPKFFQPVRERDYGSIRRVSHSKLIDEDIMEVEYTVYHLLPDRSIDWTMEPIQEHHTVTFYDPQDIRTNLEIAGYKVEVFPFMKPELSLASHDWIGQCVAKKSL